MIIGMIDQAYNGKTFLECANEAAVKIGKIHEVISGGNAIPESGSLLGDVYYCIADMIEIYLASITGKETGSDELHDMIVEIMFAGKDEIDCIVKGYCGVSA